MGAAHREFLFYRPALAAWMIDHGYAVDNGVAVDVADRRQRNFREGILAGSREINGARPHPFPEET